MKNCLKKIVSEINPDLIALCETKRERLLDEKGKKPDLIPGYEGIERNLKKGKEGLMIAAKHGTFQSIEEVTNSTFNIYFY